MTAPQLMYKLAKGGKSVQVWSAWVDGNQVIVAHGKQGGKIREKAYTAKAKNVGRSNETTPEQQAIIELQAKYVAQRDNKHYRYSIEAAQELYDDCKVPMKLENYKDHASKMVYPFYYQAKFNGSRLTYIDGDYISKRGLVEDFKVVHIMNDLARLNEAMVNNGMCGSVDGEIYCHGMSLQRIQAARKKPNEETPNLKYVIFDVPVRDVPFHKRLQMLGDIEVIITKMKLTSLQVELPELVKDSDELNAFHEQDLFYGYEGSVLRNEDSLYEFGVRSYGTQKWKPRYDAEAKVVAVTADKNGNGLLHLVASDILGNVKFKCMMKVKRRDGKEYPRDIESMVPLIGQWITFSYEELSDKGVPTKPVGEMVRDCDDKGEPLS